jgi:gluconolactonase
VVLHDSFQQVLGDDAEVKTIATKDYPFAHEAGIYDPHDDSIWFTSNLLTDDTGRKVEISQVSLTSGSVTVHQVPDVALANGGCWYDNGLLLCDQGSSDRPSQLIWVNPRNPSETRVIINNYHGRAFNSLNDVIVLDHPSGPLIFFTDPPYGNEQGFRQACEMPPAVHVLDPKTGTVRMVADGFDHPNGIAFSPQGDVCYVTDTSHIHGTGRLDPSKQSSM